MKWLGILSQYWAYLEMAALIGVGIVIYLALSLVLTRTNAFLCALIWGLGMFGAMSHIRYNDILAISQERLQDINELKAAIALTEQLHRDNAILTEERDELLRELINAEGASDLLPDDIRRIVERMRP